MAEKKKSLELKKHVGAIHSSNSLSLLQRKIANALLYNAYDELLTKEEHEISINALCKIIGYDSNDYKTIKKSLVNLLSTVIEWNLVDGQKIETHEVWNASSIISDAGIDGSICTYSYSNKMKKLLYRPELYGRLNMAVQAKFQSNYGLALYENCIRYQDIGQTPWFDIQKFRKLMGVPDSKYAVFRDFKRRVLDPAVIEVNKYSPIQISPQLKKTSRKVIAIQFMIKLSVADRIETQEKECTSDNLEQMLKIEYGFSKRQIEEALTQYNDEYIKEKISLIKNSAPYLAGKIKNLTKYLLSALKDDYQPNKTGKYIVITEIKKEKHISRLELSGIEEKRQREHEREILNAFHNLPESNKKIILKKFESSLRGLYQDIYYKHGLDNFQIQKELYNFLRFNKSEITLI